MERTVSDRGRGGAPGRGSTARISPPPPELPDLDARIDTKAHAGAGRAAEILAGAAYQTFLDLPAARARRERPVLAIDPPGVGRSEVLGRVAPQAAAFHESIRQSLDRHGTLACEEARASPHARR